MTSQLPLALQVDIIGKHALSCTGVVRGDSIILQWRKLSTKHMCSFMSQVCWKAAKQNHHCLYSCGWPLDVAEIHGLCSLVGMPTSQLIVQTNHIIMEPQMYFRSCLCAWDDICPHTFNPSYAMEAHKASPDTLTSDGYHTWFVHVYKTR